MSFQESRDTLPVIPHSHVIPRYDAVSRNTGKGNTHKRHFSGPRIECGVTRCDAVSRNTGSGTCPLRPLSGPRIVVRGDTERIVVRGDPSGM